LGTPALSFVLPGLPVATGPFVIAEAGVNHNGSLDLALRLVDAAVEAGADAIKFQTFETDRLVSASAQRAEYQRKAGEGTSQAELIRGLALDQQAFTQIAAHCAQRKIIFLSTPFDAGSADFLRRVGVPAVKIASGEITNLPFIRDLAKSGMPLIVSTGMASLGEVERAVTVIEMGGCRCYALLHCTSNYPTALDDVNLLAMRTLAQAFQCPVGYSDHTLGVEVAIAATALGAQIIEKHLTLDRGLPGPDHQASLETHEFKDMVAKLRNVALALGDGHKRPADRELSVASVVRRSLATARPLSAGSVLSETDLVALRPGTGIPPTEVALVIGRKLRQSVPAHTLIDLANIE
jgi:N,N'-diacetyllegionaminate synthase